MHLSQTVKLVAGIVALALGTALGSTPGAAAPAGTTVRPFPSQETLLVRHYGSTKLTFVALESGKVLGTYDPGFDVRAWSFSRSERFICIANNLVVPNSILLVLDRQRHFQPVYKFAHKAAGCASPAGLALKGANLDPNSRASNLIELFQHDVSGPGNCREVMSDNFWDLRRKTPKLFRGFDTIYDTCP